MKSLALRNGIDYPAGRARALSGMAELEAIACGARERAEAFSQEPPVLFAAMISRILCDIKSTARGSLSWFAAEVACSCSANRRLTKSFRKDISQR